MLHVHMKTGAPFCTVSHYFACRWHYTQCFIAEVPKCLTIVGHRFVSVFDPRGLRKMAVVQDNACLEIAMGVSSPSVC